MEQWFWKITWRNQEDKEGLRNARVVAKRMVFMINAIKDAKEKYPDLLEDEERVWTHFVK